MGVLLLFGLALQAFADALKGGPVGGVERVLEGAPCALALDDQLHHLDGDDQDGGDELRGKMRWMMKGLQTANGRWTAGSLAPTAT